MSDPSEPERLPPPVSVPTPALPEIEHPAPEDVLDGVPSKDEIIAQAEPAEQILAEQPSVDELLGRD